MAASRQPHKAMCAHRAICGFTVRSARPRADMVVASHSAYFTGPLIDIGILTDYRCVWLAGILPSTEARWPARWLAGSTRC